MKFVLFVIALDARSGQRVWRYNLGAGVNGRQYVAVAAGGNFQLTYPCGDVVAIFKLPAATVGSNPTERRGEGS